MGMTMSKSSKPSTSLWTADVTGDGAMEVLIGVGTREEWKSRAGRKLRRSRPWSFVRARGVVVGFVARPHPLGWKEHFAALDNLGHAGFAVLAHGDAQAIEAIERAAQPHMARLGLDRRDHEALARLERGETPTMPQPPTIRETEDGACS